MPRRRTTVSITHAAHNEFALWRCESSRPTEPFHSRIDELLEVGTLAHVGRDANGLATELADLPL
jgi:hypothetical protein